MQELTHFIGGKQVRGTSGRFADGFQPMTGEVISKVPLASTAEVRTAVENAKAAQPAWAATNPQRRARVLMKFLELVERDNEALAAMLAREHGKTIADAKGDIQRGVEVVGIRHRRSASDEGRVHRRRRARHRHLFDAPAARRRRRHHAVQLSGDDPDVEIRARPSPAATPSS